MNILNDEKVILILTDGMRPDAITNVEKAQKFIKESASTMEAKSVMPAITMPCHLSLFKSVDPERHCCFDNYYKVPENDVKGICEVLRRRDRKCAMFYAWEELRDLARPNRTAYTCYINETFTGFREAATMLTDNAVNYLSNNFTSFAFIHYDVIDEYGHHEGWMSEDYMKAVEFVWDEIYRILEIADENTTVIVMSDHGGHEYDHGTEEDTVIPVIIRGKFFSPGCKLENVSIKDIAPTVVKILDVAPDEAWEGKALY